MKDLIPKIIEYLKNDPILNGYINNKIYPYQGYEKLTHNSIAYEHISTEFTDGPRRYGFADFDFFITAKTKEDIENITLAFTNRILFSKYQHKNGGWLFAHILNIFDDSDAEINKVGKVIRVRFVCDFE